MKIILASTSPRRKELLEREGIDFIIDASSITEYLDSSLEIEVIGHAKFFLFVIIY